MRDIEFVGLAVPAIDRQRTKTTGTASPYSLVSRYVRGLSGEDSWDGPDADRVKRTKRRTDAANARIPKRTGIIASGV